MSTAPPVDRDGSIDRIVVGRGAAFGLLLGAPAAVANGLLAGQDPKPTSALNATLVALLVAFWISGFVGGREAVGRRTLHGVFAGGVTFALVEVIGVLGRLDRGTGVSPASMVVLGLSAIALATAGAGAGARRPAASSIQPDHPTQPGGTP